MGVGGICDMIELGGRHIFPALMRGGVTIMGDPPGPRLFRYEGGGVHDTSVQVLFYWDGESLIIKARNLGVWKWLEVRFHWDELGPELQQALRAELMDTTKSHWFINR